MLNFRFFVLLKVSHPGSNEDVILMSETLLMLFNIGLVSFLRCDIKINMW